jgi:hypothetical protein
MTIELFNYLIGCGITFTCIIILEIIQYLVKGKLEITLFDILVFLGFTAMSWIGLIYPIIGIVTKIPWSKTILKIKRKKKRSN